MSTAFLSHDIWPQVTKAVRGSRQPCAVAVAYCGAGASRLLPLCKGSRLVVDASERAVASGQTCPADLIKFVKSGVVVYSVPNLHAKVFVVGRAAYIGSANVSNRSAAHLVEAVVRTTEPSAVAAARQFVRTQCLHQLSPRVLKQLVEVYRPPLVPGGRRGKRRPKDASSRATLPRLLLAQLELQDWSERDQGFHDEGWVVAKKRRLHPRTYRLDSFRCPGKCPYQRGDVLIQVTDEGNGKVFVEPPGNVLYVRTRQDGARRVSFVYVEQPVRRRRQVRLLARAIGCKQTRLRRDGLVREASFAHALLSSLAETL